MLNSLRLQNFKRFRDLQFNGFRRVNILTGKNNCGKTSVLEAILLLLDWQKSGKEFVKVFRLKGSQVQAMNLGNEEENLWKWQFPLRKLIEVPRVTGEISGFGEYTITLQWRDKPNSPMPFLVNVSVEGLTPHVVISAPGKSHGNHQNQTVPIATDHSVAIIPANPRDPSQEAKDYARVTLKTDAEDQVEEMLRKIEPRLKSIRSLQPYGVPLLYVGIDGLPERIPAIQLGHGFSRLLSIMAEIVASAKPIILIDEIENGLHHSALIDIWRGLLTACEHSDVQIFATTHSWECVAAAHQAFSESLEYPLAVFRLEAGKEDVSVVAYDRESLQYSIEHEWEVR